MATSTPLDNQPVPGSAPSEPDGPVVIEVRDLHKSFQIPEHKIDSLKERAAHPFTKSHFRELHALNGISFDVHHGEFFGIVGRNGSGKSTLLKLLASIYRADAGSVRIAGRLAPFIELGVGFNMEMTAKENGVLNGVLMGLSQKEARYRLDSVVDFAELSDFADLKLKNYSSGMMVRLAFAVMVQADADIMLIDEVLAVGDAAFAQKCMDFFRERRRAGKTLVLVTHDMTSVEDICDRAMLIHDGDIKFIGNPAETAMRYYRLNFGLERTSDSDVEIEAQMNATPSSGAAVVKSALFDREGEETRNLEQGTPIAVDAVIRATDRLVNPKFVVHALHADGTVMFGFSRDLNGADVVEPGQEVHLSGKIENPMAPGDYVLNCWVRRDGEGGQMLVQALELNSFKIFGTGTRHGVIVVESDVEASLITRNGDGADG